MDASSVRLLLPRCAATASAAFVLAAALSAQRTWIVDAAGGAGVDFTDLPPAFAAVSDGDRVLVRRGVYNPARLNKAVQVVGEPGATVVAVNLSTPPFEITGIAAGRTCAIRGLRFPGLWINAPLRVHGNAGLVVLSDLTLEVQARVALEVADCQAVSVANSLVRPSMDVVRSTLSATGCTFQAYDEGAGGSMAVAVTASASTIELAQCSAFGSNSTILHAPSTSAVRADSTALLLRGDGNSRYVGGILTGFPRSPSIDGSGSSTLVVDPTVVLTAPPVNLLSLVPRRMAALTVRGGAMGGSLDLELSSPAGDLLALFAALPAVPFAVPPFGVQWMDLPSEVLLGIRVQGASEHTVFSFPRGNDPALRGLALAFQALAGPGLQSLALSNPAIPVLP